MAESLSGQAFVWGLDGFSGTLSGGSVIASISKVQSYDYERSNDKEYLNDANGEAIGRADFNAKQMIRVNVIPSHSGTIATARTNLALLLPAPGAVVTAVADTDVSTITGNWKVNSSKLSRTNRSIAAIDLELEKYDANDITTAIS